MVRFECKSNLGTRAGKLTRIRSLSRGKSWCIYLAQTIIILPNPTTNEIADLLTEQFPFEVDQHVVKTEELRILTPLATSGIHQKTLNPPVEPDPVRNVLPQVI
jgi:hypothetical protein